MYFAVTKPSTIKTTVPIKDFRIVVISFFINLTFLITGKVKCCEERAILYFVHVDLLVSQFFQLTDHQQIYVARWILTFDMECLLLMPELAKNEDHEKINVY